MDGIEHVKVTNEEFMEDVAWYECVYNRNSKNFKDKNKKANSWEIIGEKLHLSCLRMNIFRIQNRCSLRFEADVVVALGLKKEINLLAASTTRVYI